VNDANIPAHVVHNPKLWNIIEFMSKNGKRFLDDDRSTLAMAPYKYDSIQAMSFARMVTTIEQVVEDTCSYFSNVANKSIPSIYIGHDIWDGRNKSVLGLCIFIISPLLEKMATVPVGILRSYGKSAQAVASHTLLALKRYLRGLYCFC
jgi:hypothetical protein